MKIGQGIFTFFILLLLLWLPLLLFASSNPTFQTPSVTGVKIGVKLVTRRSETYVAGEPVAPAPDDDPEPACWPPFLCASTPAQGSSTATYVSALPLWYSNEDFTAVPFALNSASNLPLTLRGYDVDQVQLLCSGADSD